MWYKTPMIKKFFAFFQSLLNLDPGDIGVGVTLHRSLNLVIWSVCFGIIFFNITTGFPLAGFARELGFGDFLYAVMLAMPVLGGTVQIVASLVLERKRNRKAIFLWSLLVNRFPWILVAFSPFFIGTRGVLFLTLVVSLTISSIGGAFTNVSFLSWMGDLVPLEVRGRFFGHRTMIATVAALISGLVVGKLLDTMAGISGFAFVFALASIAGLMELFFFAQTYDPPMTVSSLGESPALAFREILCCRPFWKFLFFVITWNFAVNVASPFFNLYMLKHLHMDFFQIAFYVQVISNVATLFFVRVWGRLTDRFGNKPVAVLSTTVAIFLPLIWCYTTSQNWIVVVPIIQTLAGVFWPGIDLTTNNLLLKLSPKENRSLYVGVLNFFLGTFGIAFAYLVGGYVLEKVVPLVSSFVGTTFGWQINPYYYVFFLSSFLRFLSCMIFLSKVEETGAQSLCVVLRETCRTRREK
ncbi:MAG: MFS transporter [Atribacterota bacterium]